MAADEVDYSKSTGRYPTEKQPAVVLASQEDEVDYSKSTGAFPMDTSPQIVIVESDVDYAKSVNRYPMIGEPVPVVTEHIGAEPVVRSVTPGPTSAGVSEEAISMQRASLGLSDDPSGESDAGAAARPSTIPMAGADGIDRETIKVIESPEQPEVTGQTTATTKTTKPKRA